MPSRIINVTRKPRRCPICGEPVWDIIYGSGEMKDYQFLLKYRKNGVMGGDNIPRRPPVWSCSCGCVRFRKVLPNGGDAPVKIKLLKNVRPAPALLITWESSKVTEALKEHNRDAIHYYSIEITTDLDGPVTFSVCAVSKEDALDTIDDVLRRHDMGLKSHFSIVITEKEREG